jgi:hypothetical protein
MRIHVLTAAVPLLLAAGCGTDGGKVPDAGAGRDGDVVADVEHIVNDGEKPGGDRGTSDGTTCLDKCTKGVAQCVNAQLQTCVVKASGCTDWDVPKDCSNGKACNAGACPTCTDSCTFGNTQCSSNKVQR